MEDKVARHCVIKWLLKDFRRKKTFTTRQVVDHYIEWRTPRGWRTIPYDVNDLSWVEMNAHNHLTACVQLGILERVKRGVYRWK